MRTLLPAELLLSSTRVAPELPDLPPFAHTSDLVSAYQPSDNYFQYQWHLLNTGQGGATPGIDLNVTGVWDDYTGEGVTVGVYDDGVEYTHPDLDGNYDTSLHITINGAVHDGYTFDSGDAHGTAVAGLIAAENDGVGTVGVAYDATIAGVDIFSLTMSELDAAMGEQWHFDVVNHSWGWSEAFADSQLDPAWSDFFAGIEAAADLGRDGLGTIMTVAAGNFRGTRDANDSNLVNVRYTIAVGATDLTGDASYYSNPGASLLVSAPSSDTEGGIFTTDRQGFSGYDVGDYTGIFGGTSAAAPMVAGVTALMLEANPDLGWRDVQTILAYSARHVGSDIGSGPTLDELYQWSFNGADDWNGGGLHFSNDYGFGLVDALAAVRLAETWTLSSTSANEASTSATVPLNLSVPDNDANGVTFQITLTEEVDIESIALELGLTHRSSDQLFISITSPEGTESILQNGTGEGASLKDWIFTSNAFKGESSVGTWTVFVSDSARPHSGSIDGATLTAYGSVPSSDDLYIFTNEFSDYAGLFGHATVLSDGDGGVDTLNLAAVTSPSTIDLTPGAGGIIDGVAVTIDSATQFENLYTGDGDDSLTGNGADNLLSGGRGNDLLYGGLGDDLLYGGRGGDLYVYDAAWGNDFVFGFDLGGDFFDFTSFTGVTFGDLSISETASGSLITLADSSISVDFGSLLSLDQNSFIFDSFGVDGLVDVTAEAAIGQDVAITLIDSDLNWDPLAVDLIWVTVENSRTGEKETMTLSETAADSGVFSGSVSTVFGQGAGSDLSDGLFNVLGGDRLTVTYRDTMTSSGTGIVDRSDQAVIVNRNLEPFSLDFNSGLFSSYESSQDKGSVTIEDGGLTAHLAGNAWKKWTLNYDVSENTVLTFEVRIDQVGEYQGIGVDFDNDWDFSNNQAFFYLAGTASPTESFTTNYSGAVNADGTWQTVQIDLGSYFTGTINYLTFLNDHDASPSDAEALYRNVQIYEGSITPTFNLGFDIVFTDGGAPLTVDVLGNDQPIGMLDIVDYTDTVHGTLTFNDNGTGNGSDNFTYTAVPGFVGLGSFTYTATDGETTDTQTARIYVGEGLHLFAPGDISSYETNQDAGGLTLPPGGLEAQLTGNAWKKAALTYDVTATTILRFEVQIVTLGEYQGVGIEFDNDFGNTNQVFFYLAGTQSPTESFTTDLSSTIATDGTWQTIEIDLGSYYSGQMNYLTFINDHDLAPGNAEANYRNFQLYEGTFEQPFSLGFDLATTDGDQPLTVNVLDNDFPADSLDIVGYSDPLYGTLAFNDNGAGDSSDNFTYTAAPGFIGLDSFTYSATDGETTDTQTARIYVGEGLHIFAPDDISSYERGQDKGGLTLPPGGLEAQLTGNAWKKAALSYDVTENTILRFDVRVDKIGEYQGIGVEVDNDWDNTNQAFFYLAGTQTPTESFTTDLSGLVTVGGDWQTIEITLGDYFLGQMNYLTFVNDHDARPKDAEAWYRNIQIYEDSGGAMVASSTQDPNLSYGDLIDSGDGFDVGGEGPLSSSVENDPSWDPFATFVHTAESDLYSSDEIQTAMLSQDIL